MVKHPGLVIAARCWAAWSLRLWIVVALSASCSGGMYDRGPLVRLRLSTVDPAASQATLTVMATSPAGQSHTAAQTFSAGPFEELGVSFPAGTRGTAHFEVQLIGAPECPIAAGSTSLLLDSDGVFDVPVTMSSVPLCGNGATLKVQVAKVLMGAGSVISNPPGINCQGVSGSGCSAVFKKGTQLTLTAQATSGSFSGWAGAGCSGSSGCSFVLSQDSQLQAVFTGCQGWCKEPLPFPVTANLYGIAGTGAGNVLVVGAAGTALLFDGATWQQLQPPSGNAIALRAAAARTGGSAITVAGDNGTILQLSGTTFQSVSNSSTRNLKGITIGYGATPTTFFVGDNGTALVLPSGATSVSSKNTGIGVTIAAVAQNLNATKDDLLLVGTQDFFQAYARAWDGNTNFSGQMTGPGANISSNASAVLCGTGTFWAVGDSGALVSRTSAGGAFGGANTWTKPPLPAGVTANLRAIWSSSDSNVVVVGDAGTVLLFNGSAWTRDINVPTANNLRAVWGTGPSNFYVVGDNGTILHYLP